MAPSAQHHTALIVGGSAGIGLATAHLLVARGVSVILVARGVERLEKAAVDLRSVAGKAEVAIWPADVAKLSATKAHVISKIEALPDTTQLRYLVNSAGLFVPKPFLEHTESDYDAYHNLNRSTYFITQAVSKRMKASGGGSIVNVGSMWAKQAIKATPSTAYSMAKAALHSLTQTLAMELADHSIRVNAVSPAVVATPIYGGFIEQDKLEETMRSFDAFHPIGRVGEAADVANAIDFLLDENKSAWITGAIMDVDGGVMAGRN